MAGNLCTVCDKLFTKKGLSFEGKKFCCAKCCGKFKKSKQKNVCEFC